LERVDENLIRDTVARALAEDIGDGDVTSEAIVPADARARALITQKAPGVVFGLQVAEEAFRQLDPGVTFERLVPEGSWREGGPVLGLEGLARAILTGERTALNFLQRLSGVATITARYVRAVESTGVLILDTRKTTPGLRALEKYAVRCGGGYNHRFGLDDAILIKDNHIAVAGGIEAVLRRAKKAAGHLVKIEIEVDSLDQLREVLDVGLADVVLIDNFDLESMRKAVAMVAGRLVIEASGGITLASAAAIAETGVDYLSSGALTHSVQNLDVGLDIAM
jgi:nicotinate-nucleotide pyrophosphorylase (carboxylating)